MSNFICYQKAVELYRECKKIQLKAFMKDQLLRAMSSVALNLAEGNVRNGLKDKRKFFNIALSSLREVQCICELEDIHRLKSSLDQLGAMLYVLNRKLSDSVTEAENRQRRTKSSFQ